MSERAALISLVDGLTRARALCVGDIMLDRFVTGAVERISPEAPIPVLRVMSESAMLGGVGNVVRNLSALGASGRVVAVVGDDAAGREIAALAAEHPSIEADLIVAADRPTAIKTRYLSGNQQLMRADREDTRPLAAETARQVLGTARAALADCTVLVLSDYAKGLLGTEVTGTLIEAARQADKTVIVDPKGADYGRYRGASVLTPNRAELAQASRMPTGSDAEIAAAARALIETHGVDAVLATRSREGMTLVGAGTAPLHLPTEAREVFDVSGAGDTVVATLAAALAAGADLPQAAALANVAAGVVVGKVGTAAAYAEDVVAALHHRDLSSAEAKVMGLKPLMDRITAWRRQGLSVGFTNGCFDLLHPGHVSLLAQARAACDRLVVGLNSDSSVRGLKGPERPVQNEAARAAVLASLASVDAVTLFAEETPLVLIETLRPDVLVKGADYALSEVVGAEVVKEAGGRVLLVNLEPGHSTSGTIARINGNGKPKAKA